MEMTLRIEKDAYHTRDEAITEALEIDEMLKARGWTMLDAEDDNDGGESKYVRLK